MERGQWTDAADGWIWFEVERFCELTPGLEIKLHGYGFCGNWILHPVCFADENFISWFLPAIKIITQENLPLMLIKYQYI